MVLMTARSREQIPRVRTKEISDAEVDVAVVNYGGWRSHFPHRPTRQ